MKIHILCCTMFLGLSNQFQAQEVCNDGFENHNQFSTFPNNRSQLEWSECWKTDQWFLGQAEFHTPDWFVIENWNLEEDLSSNGVFTDILGNNNSNGYAGIRSCELIQQELETPLVAGNFHAVTFFVRIPALLNRVSQNNTIAYPTGDPVKFKIVFANADASYDNNYMTCLDGEECYSLSINNLGQSSQLIEFEFDPNDPQYAPGSWHRVTSPSFKAKKDYSWMILQSQSLGERVEDCPSYILIDDISIVKNCDENVCLSCSFTSGDKVVSSNQQNTGTDPLRFFGLENVKSISVDILDQVGNFIYSDYGSCTNGWENGTFEMTIPTSINMSVGYYIAQVILENDCGVCIKSYSFYFQDYYTGSLNTCPCRIEGIIQPCCETSFEASQYNITCQTNSAEYAAINDLEVGTTNAFVVESGTDAYFTAQNSIVFGPNFESENTGTFTAEITPCVTVSNKKGSTSNEIEVHGIENSDLKTENVLCFPNPSDGIVNVFIMTENPSELYIYDALGISHVNQTITPNVSYSFDLQKSGIYFFRFQQDGAEVVKKIVVQ